MAAPIAFESTWKKKEYREEKSKYREQYVERLKAQHEKAERKLEQAKQRGEDTWMLPSVSERVTREEQDLLTAQSKKKKKKDKKKKEKKHKKKKRHSTSGSGSDSDRELKWSEVTADKPDEEQKTSAGPHLQRDSWMLAPNTGFDALPSFSKTEFNEQRQIEKGKIKDDDQKDTPMVDQLGQHERELNPYWKGGGSGLPEEESNKKKPSKSMFSPSITSGDGGAGWLRKAFERCVQQAKDEGRTLEDVAADRYGSLQKLESLLSAAEKNEQHSRHSKRQRIPDRDRYKDRYTSSSASGNNDRGTDTRNRDSERSRGKFKRPSSEDEAPPEQSHSRHSASRGSDLSSVKSRSFLKPPSDDAHDKDTKRRFMKPGEISEQVRYGGTSSNRDSHNSAPRWKKQEAVERERRERSKEKDRRRSRSRSRERDRRDTRRESRSRSPDRRRKYDNPERRSTRISRSRSRERRRPSRSQSRDRNRRRSRSPDKAKTSVKASTRKEDNRKKAYSSSSDSDAADSSSSSNDSESDQESVPPPVAKLPPRILTETELNELGAKMVRAEIMGDEELAAKLKAEINEARSAMKQAQQNTATTATNVKVRGEQSEKAETIVLTRTDRSGMVRPLPASQHEHRDRRRKKQKVKTHSEGGSRERYFHDDDNKDLKSLFEQEKLGTAEDSNYQFLKLAGKAFKGKNPEEMDELFMEGAAKKGSEGSFEIKDRAKAIAEHRKMAAVMEKCHLCFEKVPKHLIIAIGLKVYLCLPNHRSMAEGHCLIVPMQHTTQSTILDEDVFEEIQVYRRALTKMYEMQDLDCVFMETCLQLHKQRHMAIECVPLPRELGDMAPIYFKKALQESESEWSQNKKVVDLSKKNIRNAIPKGFPYFAVDFGLHGGFAHVIEDEKDFPYYFGREVLGGMMDLEPTLWRKPHKENFDDQRKKVLHFAEWWKPVDWTQKLRAMEDSD